MFRKIIACMLLTIGLILPWKARCLYIELLGWCTQTLYYRYIVILKFILQELQKAQKARKTHES